MAAERQQFFIHAGLPKTGTSYLQDVLFESSAALREQGVDLVPEQRYGHFTLTLQVRGMLREFDSPEAFRALDTFRGEVARHPGQTALLTQESLSAAGPDAITTVLEPLGDHDVHLVVSARDLGRQLPSAWQQKIKGRRKLEFGQFLDIVERRADAVAERFWLGQDLIDVLDRWAATLPPERVHVLTVPQAGAPPGLLLSRFCSVLGLDPSTLDTDAASANVSLGYPQAELLRRINIALGDRLPHSRSGYRRVARSWLSDKVLLRQDGPRIRVPHRLRPWVEATTDGWIEHVRSTGYDVVGDLDELRTPSSAYDDNLRELTDTDLLDVALTALADILELRDREVDLRQRAQHHTAVLERRVHELEERGVWWPPRRLAGRLVSRWR